MWRGHFRYFLWQPIRNCLRSKKFKMLFRFIGLFPILFTLDYLFVCVIQLQPKNFENFSSDLWKSREAPKFFFKNVIFLQKVKIFLKNANLGGILQPPPHTPWNSCKQSTSLDWTLQFRFVHLQTFAFNRSKSSINFQIFDYLVFIY